MEMDNRSKGLYFLKSEMFEVGFTIFPLPVEGTWSACFCFFSSQQHVFVHYVRSSGMFEPHKLILTLAQTFHSESFYLVPQFPGKMGESVWP